MWREFRLKCAWPGGKRWCWWGGSHTGWTASRIIYLTVAGWREDVSMNTRLARSYGWDHARLIECHLQWTNRWLRSHFKGTYPLWLLFLLHSRCLIASIEMSCKLPSKTTRLSKSACLLLCWLHTFQSFVSTAYWCTLSCVVIAT